MMVIPDYQTVDDDLLRRAGWLFSFLWRRQARCVKANNELRPDNEPVNSKRGYRTIPARSLLQGLLLSSA